MEAPKLELSKNKERLARLEQVKESAKNRTNRRIRMILDDIAEQKAKKGLTSGSTQKAGK